MTQHRITDNNVVADDHFQPIDIAEHRERLAALVREMASIGRVVVLVEDGGADRPYLVTHHAESITVRPRRAK
jgi:hypothetical protein